MSADESVNNAERLADYWVFGGIFRPVYLEVLPQEFIDHTSIDAKASGDFRVNVFLSGVQQSRSLLAEILDSRGKVVGSISGTVKAKDSLVQLSTKIKDPLLW